MNVELETNKAPFLESSHLEGCLFTGEWETRALTAAVVEPATGATLAKIALADPDQVTQSAKRASSAQKLWAATDPAERALVLAKAAALLESHAAEAAHWLVREGGGAQLKANFEIAVTVKALWLAATLPEQAQGLVLPSVTDQRSSARRKPRGLIGIISPFNFPLYLAMRAVAPALALGNGVILKPDPRTAICGGHVIARLFELAGLPKGLLHVLPGGGEVGEALCCDPHIAMIQFTGSTGAGRAVGQLAGRHLKKVSLELGGKNPLIVLDDADIDAAATNVAWGAYLHQGQICMATGRVLVHESIAARFIDALAAKARAIKTGNPVSEEVFNGPLINQRQADHVRLIVDDTLAQGAVLEAGGKGEGLFYQPTVLSGVRPGMRAFDEEIFGPVAVVTSFSTEDEAITLANMTDYGLSAAVFSRDVGRAMRVGDQLHAGLLHINDQTVGDDVVNPFGGFGASGNGAAIGGPANLDEFTEWQWVTLRDTPPAYPI
ncbi:benzaldehyde dehydrogenase [Asaia spathodeae]|uniref:Benzaldehyde dehydrogenase n=1 Tax=Asaia spathodeae TaxID=657016 RepID=A0ABX2P4X4_9PROT|nr:benzaldehyde dehydrogenase [Asaia spathodeae]GBR11139.1 NAD-dependent aldehyde dehydrogenase [Asaia spathodeae NBRC 105894]